MFNVEWEVQFLFALNSSGVAQCMVCYRTIATIKKYNLERHYSSNHSDYDDYVGEARDNLVLSLKATFEKRMSPSSSGETPCNMHQSLLEASYIVSLSLAKQCRPFEDGMFFKDLSKLVLKCFGSKGTELVNLFERIPLSRRTICRRTEEIDLEILSAVKEKILESKYYSICLDESTDINDISQLIICIKTVNEQFEVHEEILSVVSMHSNVKGKNIYEAVDQNLFSFADKNKLSAVCTDGANVMTGKNDGFIGQLMKNGVFVPSFHCIIHQQNLLSKVLNMAEAMKIAVKIVNRIRGGHNALKHRQFVSFLEELEANYSDLLLYTEVRWLSRGKCLQRLFDLREEVLLFLENDSNVESQDLSSYLKCPNFLLDLAFLVDITNYLNELNIALQGRNKSIIQLVSAVDAFERKLNILNTQFKEGNLTYLPKTSEILAISSNHERLSQYNQVFDILITNYKSRFQDFSKIRNVIEFYENPLSCDTDQQNCFIQRELRDMREDLSLPLDNGIDFWKRVNIDTYPYTKEEVYKLLSMFGTTYLCESTFSSLKIIKSKLRNRLSDKHIEALLRIKHCDFDIDLKKLAAKSSETSETYF